MDILTCIQEKIWAAAVVFDFLGTQLFGYYRLMLITSGIARKQGPSSRERARFC